MSQEDFASRLGVSTATIRRILAGADDLSYPMIIAVAHVTGIPEQALGGAAAKRRIPKTA